MTSVWFLQQRGDICPSELRRSAQNPVPWFVQPSTSVTQTHPDRDLIKGICGMTFQQNPTKSSRVQSEWSRERQRCGGAPSTCGVIRMKGFGWGTKQGIEISTRKQQIETPAANRPKDTSFKRQLGAQTPCATQHVRTVPLSQEKHH